MDCSGECWPSSSEPSRKSAPSIETPPSGMFRNVPETRLSRSGARFAPGRGHDQPRGAGRSGPVRSQRRPVDHRCESDHRAWANVSAPDRLPTQQRVLQGRVLKGETGTRHDLDRTVVGAIEVLVHTQERQGADRFEYGQQTEPVDFGPAPRPGEFTPDPIAKSLFPFENDDIQAAPGQHARQRRTGEAAPPRWATAK